MNIFITLDYELFLGDVTGTPENCLIRPMDALCKSVINRNVYFTIFVDATYLLRLSQLKDENTSLKEHYILVCNHIKKLVSLGHDIQLHIHPQWIYSKWNCDKGSWTMDFEHYKLSDLKFEDAFRLIKESKELLDSIIGYSTSSFRAGGFCLDNFSDYSTLFKEIGIRVDSSVVRDQFINSDIHFYDYRSIPDKQIYQFSDTITKEKVDGCFTELSISSFNCSSIYFLKNIRNLRKNYCPKVIYKDGQSINDGDSLFWHRIRTIFTKYNTFCTIDGSYSSFLDVYYDYASKKGQKELVLIGHPKNASDASIINLQHFIDNHMTDNFYTVKDL